MELVERLLQHYVGTHNYHNFTKGKEYREQSSMRHILSFKVMRDRKCESRIGCSLLLHHDQTGERFVAGNLADTGSKLTEFIPLKVKGHSFMQHQIRKMIGETPCSNHCMGLPSIMPCARLGDSYSAWVSGGGRVGGSFSGEEV